MKNIFAFFLFMYCYLNTVGQKIIILDTVRLSIENRKLKLDSSFVVEGEIIGLDSGNIKITANDNSLLAFIPFKRGKFYFSGFVNSLEMVHFLITGDYYNNAFYIEPGQIKIKYIYQNKFTATGTKENDLNNYFNDTLNKKNTDRFWDLNNKIDVALKDQNLVLYLSLIDSFTIVENDFFRTINEAIALKKFGDYLLSYVNYFYINYSYFSERRAIFDQLPERIKNSSSGKKALDYLEYTKIKNTAHINETAYLFTLKDINNKLFSLNKFKGKIIVLDFWASWCLPCIKALPLLKKIQTIDVSQNVVYISVSIDKNEKDWRRKEKNIHIPWISLLANDATIKNYEMNAVPSYIIINKEGKIASRSSSLGNLYITLKGLKK